MRCQGNWGGNSASNVQQLLQNHRQLLVWLMAHHPPLLLCKDSFITQPLTVWIILNYLAQLKHHRSSKDAIHWIWTLLLTSAKTHSAPGHKHIDFLSPPNSSSKGTWRTLKHPNWGPYERRPISGGSLVFATFLWSINHGGEAPWSWTCMTRGGDLTEQLHGVVLVLHLFLSDGGDAAVQCRVEGVLGQHGSQELLVLLLLLPATFAFCFHPQAKKNGSKRKTGSEWICLCLSFYGKEQLFHLHQRCGSLQ